MILDNKFIPSPEKALLNEWESLRMKMERFKEFADGEGSRVYKQKEIEEDEKKVEKELKGRGEKGEWSDLTEALLVIVPDQFGWLGTNPRFVEVTTQYSDFFDRVDAVKEIIISRGDEQTVLRWAEDVTHKHPKNHRSDSERVENIEVLEENRQKVWQKIKGIKDGIMGKGEAGYVKYYESEAAYELGTERIIEPTTMPKVVISLPTKTIKELMDLYTKAKEGDKKATTALREHPARLEYLSQIRIALEAQIALLNHRIYMEEDQPKRVQQYSDAKRRAEEILNYINGLIEEIDPEYEMQNEWLRDMYQEMFGEYMDRE
ncbi:MAG: hypothetical protein COT89_02785 [Candidatus Colwellbacteria bacterium CG10_big_fil_rev_8_21_14_0_10_42_22]|uniref:Uncharacterized protein n=1 Tax=Candidatus Colwellbacteria bacterium CG10_big_fil_rev_8_21_14_0_10_42_22 TaxID=1974540 RepID=A0A2H0VFF1_9BACT|nr:MAG: hypothetical protein COT89_02785 [Candidatus Colwellbacteria bacterium CG10_big_fil_rev_8_21_14_0_10_42_22]